MAYAPTATEILDCNPVRRRADDFRFDLYSSNRELIGELHPDASRVPIVSNDTGRAVRRQLSSFNLPPSELSAIALTDSVVPVMVLQNGDEESLGWFQLADDGEAETNRGLTRGVSWYDRCNALNQQTERTIAFNKGANVVIAMLGVLLEVVPVTDLLVGPESDTVLGAPLQWAPGTNRIRILDTLTDLLGWLPLYFNRHGYVQFADTPDLETASPDVVYPAGNRIFDGSVLRNNDLLTAPNRFVVYETSGRSTVTGRYDIPASAPHSIANRGFVVADVTSVQGLGSTSAANKMAKSRALRGRKIYRWLNFTSPADYRHDTWNVLDVEGEIWLELAWSLTCQPGPAKMTHKCRRVY